MAIRLLVLALLLFGLLPSSGRLLKGELRYKLANDKGTKVLRPLPTHIRLITSPEGFAQSVSQSFRAPAALAPHSQQHQKQQQVRRLIEDTLAADAAAAAAKPVSLEAAAAAHQQQQQEPELSGAVARPTVVQAPKKSVPRKVIPRDMRRTSFKGRPGPRPLAITNRAGLRTLKARGFKLSSGAPDTGVQTIAAAATAERVAVASDGNSPDSFERLATPAGFAYAHPTVLIPAPAMPAEASFPNSTSPAMQADDYQATEIYLPLGVTSVGFYAVGQGSALNTCNVRITVKAYSYESPTMPSVLTQVVPSCGVSGPIGSFFGFAVVDLGTDELVRLVIEVPRGVAIQPEAPENGEEPLPTPPPPEAGVLLSELQVSTNRPSNPSAVVTDQPDMYLEEVLGITPLVTPGVPALGSTATTLSSSIGTLLANRQFTVQAAPGQYVGDDATVLATSAAAPFVFFPPVGTTAISLAAGALDPCLGPANVRLVIRAYTKVTPVQSNNVKSDEDELAPVTSCTGGRFVAPRKAAFWVDGSVANDYISRVEVSLWTNGSVAASAMQLIIGDLRISKEPQATGDQMRLVPPTGSGSRVEVLKQGKWGTICGEGWSEAAAAVSCRQAGFHGGAPTTVAGGILDAPIWLKDIKCTGKEASLGNCSSTVLSALEVPPECTHETDAGVLCHEDDMLGFLNEWYPYNFLDEQLSYDVNNVSIPVNNNSGPAGALAIYTSVETPSGRISFNPPVGSANLPVNLKLPDGSQSAFTLGSFLGADTLTLTFPPNTKAFGLTLAADACSVKGGGSTSVVFDMDVSIGFKNTSYPWWVLSHTPGCGEEGAKFDVGAYVGMYVVDPALDDIKQIKITVPKYSDGSRVPMLLGGVQISTHHVLQDRLTSPQVSIAAADNLKARDNLAKKNKEAKEAESDKKAGTVAPKRAETQSLSN